MPYYCSKCNKTYSSYKSHWNHIKRFHFNETLGLNNTQTTQNIQNIQNIQTNRVNDGNLQSSISERKETALNEIVFSPPTTIITPRPTTSTTSTTTTTSIPTITPLIPTPKPKPSEQAAIPLSIRVPPPNIGEYVDFEYPQDYDDDDDAMSQITDTTFASTTSMSTSTSLSSYGGPYECTYCFKMFSRKDNMMRHYKTCKNKSSTDLKLREENILLQKQIIKITDKMNDLKKQLLHYMNKNCKVHPKTLVKINKQLNNCNNNIITNNYNIIQLGKEELSQIFSNKEKLDVLNKGFESLDFLVSYTHFNDKYPQFKNILITNTQNDLAYKYNEATLQFDAVKKDELLEEIVSERMYNINEFLDEFNKCLSSKTKGIIASFINNMKNKNYEEWKKKNIKLIIYNNRNKVNVLNSLPELQNESDDEEEDIDIEDNYDDANRRNNTIEIQSSSVK
jgi:septum formation topological specificity factor MinE